MADLSPRTLQVSVVSADAEIWTGVARQVVARTKIGQIGLLAGHEPVLGILDQGLVRITTPEGTVVEVSAQDGFLSLQADIVTIVAGTAELVS
jgi:F-type H+-transporting ATPase subunit epsilon